MTTREPNRLTRPNLTEQLSAVVRSIETNGGHGRHAAADEGYDRSVGRRLDRIDETLSEISLHLHGTLTARLEAVARDRDTRRSAVDEGLVAQKVDALARVVTGLASAERLDAMERQTRDLSTKVASVADELPHRVSDAVMRSGEVVLKAAGSLWSDVDEIKTSTRTVTETTGAMGRVLAALSQAMDRVGTEVTASAARDKELPDRLGRIEGLLSKLDQAQRAFSDVLADRDRCSPDPDPIDQRLGNIEAMLGRVADAPDPAAPWRDRVSEQLDKLADVESAIARLAEAPDRTAAWREAVAAKLDRIADELAETKRAATIPPKEFHAANTSFQHLTTGFRFVLRRLSEDAETLHALMEARHVQPSSTDTTVPDAVSERLAGIETMLSKLQDIARVTPDLKPLGDRLSRMETAMTELIVAAKSETLTVVDRPDFAGALAAAPELDMARTHVQQLLAGFRVILRQIGDDARAFNDLVMSVQRPTDPIGPRGNETELIERMDAIGRQLDLLAEKADKADGLSEVTTAIQAIERRLQDRPADDVPLMQPRHDLATLPLFEPERGQMQRLVIGFAQLVQAANAEVERLKTLSLPVQTATPPENRAVPDLAADLAKLKSDMAAEFANIGNRLSAGHSVLADLHALSTRRISANVGRPVTQGAEALRLQLETVARTMDGRLAEITQAYDRIGRALPEDRLVASPVLADSMARLDEARREITARVDEFVSVAAAVSEQLDAAGIE